MVTLDRATVRDLVLRWQHGELTERQVHEHAEALYDATEWPAYPQDDSRSIGIEVLAELSVLNAQLSTREDIPAMLPFLDTVAGQERAPWDVWNSYWAAIDFGQRRHLRNHAYYLT